jgi:hypothetical protein
VPARISYLPHWKTINQNIPIIGKDLVRYSITAFAYPPSARNSHQGTTTKKITERFKARRMTAPRQFNKYI